MCILVSYRGSLLRRYHIHNTPGIERTGLREVPFLCTLANPYNLSGSAPVDLKAS